MSGFKTKGMFLPELSLKREREKGSYNLTGGPAANTLPFQFREHVFDPLLGSWIPHAAQKSQKKRQREKVVRPSGYLKKVIISFFTSKFLFDHFYLNKF